MRRAFASLALVVLTAAPALADKPSARFVPANPTYYRAGRSGNPVRYVVIHTIEGSAGSGINTFRSGGRKVSAHYIVDWDGSITQMVKDSDTAWHAGNSLYNRQSIGIEHAGWSGRNRWTMAQYRASAAITRWACDTYGIPKDRSRIVGHSEVPGATHGDPGRYFDWELYIRLVRGEGGTAPSTPSTGEEAPNPTASNPGTNPSTGTSPGGTSPGSTPGTTAPGATPAEATVRTLRPANGEVVGTSDVASTFAGLNVEWMATRQRGVRILLEEVGGSQRYNSGYLPGQFTRHRVSHALKDGRSYRWCVRVQVTPDRVIQSAWATFRTDFTKGVVVAVSPREGAEVDSTPTLRWRYEDPDAQQVSYRVWIDDDTDHSKLIGDTKELNGATQFYFLRSRLRPNQTYYWKVGVFDGRGNNTTTAWMSFRTASSYRPTIGEGLTLTLLAPAHGGFVPAGERPLFRWAFHSTEYRDQQRFQIQIDDADEQNGILIDERYDGNHSGYRAARTLEPGGYRWRVRVTDGRETKASDWRTFTVRSESGGLANAIPGS